MGAKALAKEDGYRRKTRHIRMRYHWVREAVANGDLRLEYIPTGQQATDYLIKPLGREAIIHARQLLGLRPRSP
jgi:hypothetical protein